MAGLPSPAAQPCPNIACAAPAAPPAADAGCAHLGSSAPGGRAAARRAGGTARQSHPLPRGEKLLGVWLVRSAALQVVARPPSSAGVGAFRSCLPALTASQADPAPLPPCRFGPLPPTSPPPSRHAVPAASRRWRRCARWAPPWTRWPPLPAASPACCWTTLPPTTTSTRRDGGRPLAVQVRSFEE